MEKKYINLNYVIYDLETLKNCFTCCFLDYATNKKKEFVIHSSRNDFSEFLNFLTKAKNLKYYFVGFNNIRFDGQILQFIYRNAKSFSLKNAEEIALAIYNKAQELISAQNDDSFDQFIPEWKLIFPQIDLFKQKHYDGAAKRGTSLKWIQFTIAFENIEEMPIHHSDSITAEQIPQILSYNWNDVNSTAHFFKLIIHETDLRLNLSEEYNLPLLNASEPRMVKEIFAKFLAEDSGLDKNEIKKLKTFRKEITVSDIIFPYISFETELFQNIYKSFNCLKIDPLNLKNSFEHIFKFKEMEVVTALGGIHGCCKPGVYKNSNDFVIHDVDVTSFYPNLAIQNNLKPAHLGNNFMKIYNNIFQERKIIPKSDPRNYIYKIILNSTYGLSNEINSYFYDPLFTMSITINGQLLILKLAEMLTLKIPNLVFYQMNTDGITIGYDNKYSEEVSKICKEWEKLTALELEHAFYKKMIIMDVNNYLAESVSNKIKRKGLFAYNIKEDNFDYHKNHSFLIIPKALEQYFTQSKSVKDFILNHSNLYDFLGAVKSKKDFDINLYNLKNGNLVKEKQQKVCRYYISNDGGKLIKDFHDGHKVNVHSKEKCTILNKITDFDIKNYNINYKFYIKECEKIINSIENFKTQYELFLT